MYVPDVEFHEPNSLAEAAATLARHTPDARLLAGGTDLLVDLKTGRARVGHLVGLGRVDGLRGVREDADGLHIGALTTITALGQSDLVRRRYGPLLDATSKMASFQVRNLATVGGNIASAVPCADLPPILTAMNASVVLWSPNEERRLPLDSFFIGARQTVRRTDEILTGVVVPAPPPGFGASYARFGLRDGNTIAVAAVAASLLLDSGGAVKNARVVLGAVAPVPKLVEQAAEPMVGKPPNDESFGRTAEAAMSAAEPICDVRGSAEFRRELVGVLTRRALDTALGRAREAR